MAERSRKSDQVYRDAPRPKLSAEHQDTLLQIAREKPLLSLDDLVWALRQRTGLTVSPPTIKKYLVQAGFTRVPVPEGTFSGPSEASTQNPKRYGYAAPHRDEGDLVRYPCGLTDAEWDQVKHLFDPETRRGAPEKYPRRQMLDACIYVLRSGCSWRMLPKDFPHWSIVYRTFRRWQARGLFEAMYDELRALWRSRQHRAPEPTAVVLDSQSVRTSPQGGPKGYDAAKKIKGRKRHIVTDTLGLLIAVLVTSAATQDRDAALPAMELAKAKAPGIRMLYVDSGYEGKRANELRLHHNIEVEIVRHPAHRRATLWKDPQLPLWSIPKGFVVLPKRWVIERTNAWNDRPRRMNKDHDRNLSVSTAWIWLTEARMLLRRLAA